MASLGGNTLVHQTDNKLIYTGLAVVICAAIALSKYAAIARKDENPGLAKSLFLFCWACFIKPHQKGAWETQQDALESFYEVQAGIYDVTRKTLLQGREDMLGLVAAQLKHKAAVEKGDGSTRRIWVDVRLPTTISSKANRNRLEEERDGILRPWVPLLMSQTSSLAFTWLISRLLCAR